MVISCLIRKNGKGNTDVEKIFSEVEEGENPLGQVFQNYVPGNRLQASGFNLLTAIQKIEYDPIKFFFFGSLK